MRHLFHNLLIVFSVSALSAGGLRAQSFGDGTTPENYIINGSDATFGQYPWMVALVQSGFGATAAAQFCGGSLIDRYWVVTAAHCVDDSSPDDLVIWANLTDKSNPEMGAEMRTVRAIYIHADYNGFGFQGDIALLLLDSPIDTITPIVYSQNPVAISPGDEARAIGWGQTQVSPAMSPNILQVTDLDIVDNSSASAAYGVPLVGTQFLSAGRNGFDVCFGDSGGPLFDPSNVGIGGGPLLYGVTSFGVGCQASASIPSVFANTGHFAPWLNQFLAQPTGPDPSLSVLGKGQVVSVGNAPSKANNTNFGKRIKAGKKKTKTFLLSNEPGSIPLTVTNIAVTGRGFTLQSKDPHHIFQGVPEALKIRVRAPKSKRSRKLRGTVVITSTDPANPIYTVNLRAKSKKKKRGGSGGFRGNFFRF